jgi:predicted nucleic acid-binding protein
MALVVDSSIFITMERRRLTLSALVALTGGEPLALAAITASELLFGVHRAENALRRSEREDFVESILRGLTVLPFRLIEARVHGRLRAQLAAAGRIIGPNDLLIAATALANGYAVLTDNLREFERVPGLSVSRPAW